MAGGLMDALLGRPIANRDADGRKLRLFAALPAMGLDGLGSASYGPEAALAILSGAGAAGLAVIGPIVWAILGLLAMLWMSYWQTIAAYPQNGGSYIVSRENLGTKAGLLAASALMIDYMLNAAVGISAGVGALISALPGLQAYTLALCLGVLTVITIMNLRGTRETGLLWAAPTYLFVAGLGMIVVEGTIKAAGGHPHPVIAPHASLHAGQAITLWLILRCFAAGCTAMTGVEAVSDGVAAFADPPVRRAHQTLTAIVVILGFLLAGVAHLARAYGVTAMDQTRPGYQSVLSQLVQAVNGRGWIYDLVIGSVLAVLCVSANTSFVDFPRLCRLLARDGFLPRPFAIPGRRLVYSVGVLFLAAGAGGLLVVFAGITDRLIPLFAIGAFLSFTLSQSGMAAHWLRAERRGRMDWAKLAINGSGATATLLALLIILVAKFGDGAWLTLIVIPCIWLLLRAVRRYYDRIEAQVHCDGDEHLVIRPAGAPVALVPIRRWDRVSRRAIEYALHLSADVTAVHVTSLHGPEVDREQEQLARDWPRLVQAPAAARGVAPPRLQFAHSEYRSVVTPLLTALEACRGRDPARPIMIVLPELVDGRWWTFIMHAHRERQMRAELLKLGGADVSVVSVPWQVRPEE